jgi:hypothetical protein
MDIEKMLHDEITNDFEKLKGAEFGTDTYKSGVESVTKLMDRAIEMKKIDSDVALKKAEQTNEKRNKLIGHILAGVTTAAGIAVTVWGTKASITFEKDGVFTTIMGKNFVNSLGKFIPKK